LFPASLKLGLAEACIFFDLIINYRFESVSKFMAIWNVKRYFIGEGLLNNGTRKKKIESIKPLGRTKH